MVGRYWIYICVSAGPNGHLEATNRLRSAAGKIPGEMFLLASDYSFRWQVILFIFRVVNGDNSHMTFIVAFFGGI